MAHLLPALTGGDRRFLVLAVPGAAFVGDLCCFALVVVVLLGIGSVSYTAGLTAVLYGEYAWAFRLARLTFLFGAVAVHLYTNEDVCSAEAAVRKRQKILSLLGLSIVLGVGAYVVWLYVIVELVGLALGIW